MLAGLGLLDLSNGLAADIRHYQRSIVDFPDRLLLDDLDERDRGRFSELWVDRAQHRVIAHDNFVSGERDPPDMA
jgi:hypothetical protein